MLTFKTSEDLKSYVHNTMTTEKVLVFLKRSDYDKLENNESLNLITADTNGDIYDNDIIISLYTEDTVYLIEDTINLWRRLYSDYDVIKL